MILSTSDAPDATRSSDDLKAETCNHLVGGFSCGDYYDLIRVQVHHEDELINNRLSWMISSQAIFFAAYGIVLSNARYLIVFRVSMILIGIAITSIIVVGIRAAITMMRLSAKCLEDNCLKLCAGRAGLVPALRLSDRLHRNGMTPANLIPCVFIIAWLALAIELLASG